MASLTLFRLTVDFGPFGWLLRFPDGRAVHGLSGKAANHTRYFASAEDAMAFARRNARKLMRQFDTFPIVKGDL